MFIISEEKSGEFKSLPKIATISEPKSQYIQAKPNYLHQKDSSYPKSKEKTSKRSVIQETLNKKRVILTLFSSYIFNQDYLSYDLSDRDR